MSQSVLLLLEAAAVLYTTIFPSFFSRIHLDIGTWHDLGGYKWWGGGWYAYCNEDRVEEIEMVGSWMGWDKDVTRPSFLPGYL